MKSMIRRAAALAALAAMTVAAAAEETRVKVETSMGDFVIALDTEKAPQTTANFLQYVDDGHYNRTIFHRVVSDFVVQGGGYSRYYRERATRPPIAYEGGNGLKNLRGSVAMARQISPNSAAAQWYVNLKDNPKLDHVDDALGVKPGYAVFGAVIEGLETVDAIGAVATGPGGPFDSEVPLTPVIILSVERVEAD